MSANLEKDSNKNGRVAIRLIKNATGFAKLANREGDEIFLSQDLENLLVDNGYAEIVK